MVATSAWTVKLIAVSQDMSFTCSVAVLRPGTFVSRDAP